MIKLKDNVELRLFLNEISKLQKSYIDTEEICYPKISLYLAAKHKIFFKNLLTHPLILVSRSVFEERIVVNEKELVNLLQEVIEYEFLVSENLLPKERDKVIKLHKKLKSKNLLNATTSVE